MLSPAFLNAIRNDAATKRMPNFIDIYDKVIADDGHGGEIETWPTPRSGGPFRASIQIKERYPFVEQVAERIATSTDYIIKVPYDLFIEKTSRIKDVTPGGQGQFFEISEEVDEHANRFTNLIHCKKVS